MNPAEAIKEMLDNWEVAEASARAAHPDATEEQIYQLTVAAMNKSLDL